MKKLSRSRPSGAAALLYALAALLAAAFVLRQCYGSLCYKNLALYEAKRLNAAAYGNGLLLEKVYYDAGRGVYGVRVRDARGNGAAVEYCPRKNALHDGYKELYLRRAEETALELILTVPGAALWEVSVSADLSATGLIGVSPPAAVSVRVHMPHLSGRESFCEKLYALAERMRDGGVKAALISASYRDVFGAGAQAYITSPESLGSAADVDALCY